MIKVKLIPDGSEDLEFRSHPTWPLSRREFRQLSPDYGVQFVENNPDVILMLSEAPAFDHQLLRENKTPVIILERIDSAALQWAREYIFNSNLLGVIKNTVFRDKSLYNEPFHRDASGLNNSGMPHLNIYGNKINAPLNLEPPAKVLTPTEMDKIKPGYTFALLERMQYIAGLEVNFTSDRSLDASFAGTTKYGVGADLVGSHRSKCVSEMKKLKGCTVNAIGKDVNEPGPYNYDRYIQELLNSKIVVSPWGLGEACHRDFEALYLGCVLLKPKTSHVMGAQDIYVNNKYYIECEVDFSDLQQKVDWIKDNWDSLTEMRVNGKRMLSDWWHIPKFTEHITKQIKELVV